MKNNSHQIKVFPRNKKTWLGKLYVSWVMLNLYPQRTILIRKGRKTRLTRTFLRFSLSTFLRKLIMTMILVIRCLLYAFLDTELSRKVRKIWNRRSK